MFEFGETEQSNAFFDRNPKFVPAFVRLIELSNKCFARKAPPTNLAESICFDLGQTCRDDFVEVVFLAVNGYGIGASKLLRGLYERAVAIAHIINHPEKAERFKQFAAIQDHRAINAAQKTVSPQEFEKRITPLMLEQIRKSYEEAKSEFKRTVSWDIDFASMVHAVGGLYPKFYLGAYVIPNLHVHASMASAHRSRHDAETLTERNRQDGKVALLNATSIFLLVLRSQDVLFSLGIDQEVEACEQEVADVWFTTGANA